MRYDYACKCGHIEEVEHGMKETPKVKCKKCGKKMTKQISGWSVNMNNYPGTNVDSI